MSKIYLFITFILLCTNTLSAQIPKKQFEIQPYFRWDNYPTFTNAVNVLSTHQLTINGKSWGINAAYKLEVKNKLFLKIGIGYYKYSFSKIGGMHRSWGKSNARMVEYTAPIGDILLYTPKYWYNTFNANIGFEKYFHLNKGYYIISGLNARNYFTFSQQYNMQLSTVKNQRRYVKRQFGFSADLSAGILKQMGKLGIGASVILPIYDKWRQDNFFPTEENASSRNKWFRGIGAGINCNYSLSKIKHHEK